MNVGITNRNAWRYSSKAALFAFCVSLGACQLLPSDGPNANEILSKASANLKSDDASTEVTRFALVAINARVGDLAANFYAPKPAPVPSDFMKSSSFGRVGVGDLLHITIWEAGEVGLFSSKDHKGTDIVVRVDIDGTIALPYAGRFAVSGKRLSEVESLIVAKLNGQAVQPQATVTIAENVSSSLSVQGDVNKPGSYPVGKQNQRILDMIAIAGGSKYPPYETFVRLTRGSSTMVTNLEDVTDLPSQYNVLISAGDALLLMRATRKFLAFGAVGQPGEQIFRRGKLNISDALGQVMGLDPQRSDAKGIYLFRREPIELARQYGVPILAEDRETVPIVYQLNLKDAKSFFAMNSFPVRPNDILYVSTAPLAEASRFFQILSGATNTIAIPRTLTSNFPAGN